MRFHNLNYVPFKLSAQFLGKYVKAARTLINSSIKVSKNCLAAAFLKWNVPSDDLV